MFKKSKSTSWISDLLDISSNCLSEQIDKDHTQVHVTGGLKLLGQAVIFYIGLDDTHCLL